MYGKMPESVLPEIIPLMCTSSWVSSGRSVAGLVVAAVTGDLVGILFPS